MCTRERKKTELSPWRPLKKTQKKRKRKRERQRERTASGSFLYESEMRCEFARVGRMNKSTIDPWWREKFFFHFLPGWLYHANWKGEEEE